MHIHISDEYVHDIIVAKLQDDYEDICDDIMVIEAMNRAGETEIDISKYYSVRNSIKNVLRYHMEEDMYYEWEDLVDETFRSSTTVDGNNSRRMR